MCVSVKHPDISPGSIFGSAFQHQEHASLLFVFWLLGDPCWSLGDATASSNFVLAI